MTDWIDVPGGEVLLGLTPEEVDRLVQLNVEHNQRFLEDDVDRARWHDDRQWYEKLGGNAEALRRLLTALCPLRKVVLKPFRLARRPVLIGEYEKFRAFHAPLNSTPDQFIYGVSSEEARAYAAWAGARLPSIAEWEWAARGPSRRLFPWGPDWSSGADGFMHSASWVTGWAPGSRPGLASPEGFLDLATAHGEWCAEHLLMGASPDRLLPNAVVPLKEPDSHRNGKIRLAWDA